MGTFTNEKRWNKKPEVSTPGVGDYDLTGFKSYAKASETTFVIPEKQTSISGSAEKRFARAKSAMHRTTVSDM